MKINFKIYAVAAIIAVGTGVTSLPTIAGEMITKVSAPAGHPLSEIISGYEFRSEQTQSLQDDDFENPGFLWVDQGEEIWSKVEGDAGKSCQSCHGDASESMKKVGTEYPKWDGDSKKPINLEQKINKCRTEQMQAKPWKWESNPLLSMTTYVRHQSSGQPMNVKVDGDMAPFFEKGKKLYYQRVGQLDMACASCHQANYGVNIRSDHLSQGQTNGFPTYRLKWQKIGSTHRRFKGCMKNIRATPYKVGSDEFVNLELYIGYRGQGLPVETPAVRN